MAEENGFKLNPEKSTCILFSRQCGMQPQPVVQLTRVDIPVKTERKFLGGVLDQKLTFIPHIKQLKIKCMKTVNMLKVISHHSYGSDKARLSRLFNSLVRTRLDYGSVVYSSASKSSLKMLDPVLHLGLRLASGAFHTSPAQRLHVECDEWSLERRRTYTSLMYALKVTSIQNHPCGDLLNDMSPKNLKTCF